MPEPVTKELFDFAMSNINSRLDDMNGNFNKVNGKLDDIHEVNSKVSTNQRQLKEHDRRIGALEENQSKIVWMIITAIVGAVMTFVLSGGLKK